MPYLRKGELLPVKGYDLSIPSTYIQDGYGFPQNMHFERGEMRKRPGKSVIGTPTYGNMKVNHLSVFELSSLSSRLMMHTKRNLYKYNTVTGGFDDCTGVDLSGDDEDFYDDCVVTESDLYIFSNYIDNVRKYDDSGVSANLGGSPEKAKFCEYVTPYVFLAYLNESGLAIPTKGKWCDTGDPETWDSGNAGSHLFTDDPSPIRRAKKLADQLFVYKSGMNYRGRLVSTSDIFDFSPFSTDRGLYAPRALVNANSSHFYMGTSDFHINNGVRLEDIGGPIQQYIFNRLNRDRYETCFAMHVELFKEVWFFITTTGNDWPTEVWKYKYDKGFWYKDTCVNILTGVNYRVITTVTWDDLIGQWNDQTWRWDDQAGQAGAPIQVFGNDAGICTKLDNTRRDDNGVAVVARQETRDYTGLGNQGVIGIEQDQEWLQADFWASGSKVKIYYSIDYGETWVYVEEKELSETIQKHTTFFHVISPHIRLRFENSDSSGYFTFRSAIPYYLGSAEIENP